MPIPDDSVSGPSRPFFDLMEKALPLVETLLSHGTPGMQLAAALLALLSKANPAGTPAPTAVPSSDV